MAVEGLKRLQRKFRALPAEIQQAVQQRMEATATQWVAQMKALAPERSGALRDSIGWTWGAAPQGSLAIGSVAGVGDIRITIYAGDSRTIVTNSRGVQFQNAKLQEFGTKKMPAQPYFYPVVRAGKRGLQRSINAAARTAAKRLWEGR